MGFNITKNATFLDILLADDWNLDRTITFMKNWVPVSFKVNILNNKTF